jgi:uncharacterized protein YnzC (UPF0291/DUF896 family)
MRKGSADVAGVSLEEGHSASCDFEGAKNKHLEKLKASMKENFEQSKAHVEQILQQAPVDLGKKVTEAKAEHRVTSLKKLESSIKITIEAVEIQDQIGGDVEGLLSTLQRLDNSAGFLMKSVREEERKLAQLLEGKGVKPK